jgi:hypothetical protein
VTEDFFPTITPRRATIIASRRDEKLHFFLSRVFDKRLPPSHNTTMTELDPEAPVVPTTTTAAAAAVAVVVSPITPGGELPYEWPTNVPPPAAEVLHLWTEVGNGLEKSQTGALFRSN